MTTLEAEITEEGLEEFIEATEDATDAARDLRDALDRLNEQSVMIEVNSK